MIRNDRYAGVFWIALGLAIVVAAWRMDRFENMGATLYTAPGLVPGIYGAILILLGLVLALRSGPPRAGAGTSAPAPDKTEAGPAVREAAQVVVARGGGAGVAALHASQRLTIVLLLTLGYALLAVGRVPFAPATALFVAVFCWLFDDTRLGLRRAGSAALVGITTAIVVVLVFEKLFLVRLP